MANLTEIVNKLKDIQGYDSYQEDLIDELYTKLSEKEFNKIKTYTELEDFLSTLNYVPSSYQTGIYMNSETSVMITDYIVNNCLDEKLRYDKKILDLIFTNKFLTYKMRRDATNESLKDVYKSVLEEDYKQDATLIAKSIADELVLTSIEDFTMYYKCMVPKELQNNPEFIKIFCKARPSNIYKITKGGILTDKELAYEIIRENINDSICHANLPQYLKDYISENHLQAITTLEMAEDKVEWISNSVKSNLYKKLQLRFGKSYLEKNKDNEKKDDKILFMYSMFTSNVLEQIYKDNYYTLNDVDFIVSFVNMLENYEEFKNDYPTDRIRRAMEFYRKKYATISLEVYNAFLYHRKNEETIKALTEKLGITKENAFNYVKSQKYWNKDQKEVMLTQLSGLFNLGNVLTIYDIIDLLEEMLERGLTKEEILKEKNINIKHFNKMYDQTKETNPELFELIRSKFQANSLRGFKKFIMLYHSIMSSKIEDRNTFIEQFKRTPEDALQMFKGSEFYDDIHMKLSSWYDFEKEDEDKLTRVAL